MGKSGAMAMTDLQRASMSPMGALMDMEDALAIEGLWSAITSPIGVLIVEGGVPVLMVNLHSCDCGSSGSMMAIKTRLR